MDGMNDWFKVKRQLGQLFINFCISLVSAVYLEFAFHVDQLGGGYRVGVGGAS